MTNMEVRSEIKKLVVKKGLNNIINADLNEMHERTGATYQQMDNALNYFRYSPQAAKYRVADKKEADAKMPATEDGMANIIKIARLVLVLEDESISVESKIRIIKMYKGTGVISEDDAMELYLEYC